MSHEYIQVIFVQAEVFQLCQWSAGDAYLLVSPVRSMDQS